MYGGLVRLYAAGLRRAPIPGVKDIVVMLISWFRNVLAVRNVACWLRPLCADVCVRHPTSVQLLVRIFFNMTEAGSEILLIVTKIVSRHWGPRRRPGVW